jgi:hypothetical protein
MSVPVPSRRAHRAQTLCEPALATMLYLSYDVSGIQSYIFAIPKLKHIIGGSALIDRFDHELAPEVASKQAATSVFAGGGKGVFECDGDDQADRVREQLVDEASRLGLNLRLGLSRSYEDAVHYASELFPSLPGPEELDGHPCSESGALPVSSPDGVHPTVKRRLFDRNDQGGKGDRMYRRFEERLLPLISQHPLIPNASKSATFFHDVDPGTAGREALGGCGRWAIICMDGNGIGTQFARAAERKWSPEQHRASSLGSMSKTPLRCRRKAAKPSCPCGPSWSAVMT